MKGCERVGQPITNHRPVRPHLNRNRPMADFRADIWHPRSYWLHRIIALGHGPSGQDALIGYGSRIRLAMTSRSAMLVAVPWPSPPPRAIANWMRHIDIAVLRSFAADREGIRHNDGRIVIGRRHNVSAR